MRDHVSMFDQPLSGLSASDWRKRLERLARQHGEFAKLGARHVAALITGGPTLLVTFETIPGIRARDADAEPLGWDMVKSLGWTHLAVIADGDTWFRDKAVYRFMDRLADSDFFDRFDRVLFYGSGSGGYAAAAFSVAAPGATVLAIQPQATLDPDIAPWEDRFRAARRQDFTSRYGYAPEMIEACARCFILYDPLVARDAMHAALFRGANVSRLPARRMGERIEASLRDMQLLFPLVVEARSDRLTRPRFARLMRARRSHRPYIDRVLQELEARGHESLARRLRSSLAANPRRPTIANRLRDLLATKD